MMMGWKVTYKPIDTEPKVNDIHSWNTALTIDEIQSIYFGEKRPEDVRPESYTSKPKPVTVNEFVLKPEAEGGTIECFGEQVKVRVDDWNQLIATTQRERCIRAVLRDKSLSSIRREEKIRVILDERARI